MMTTSRTTSLLHSVQGLLPRRTHDLRWVRLYPQLLGAHAAQGWTKLIENVDVALAHALAAPQLLAGEEPRFGAIADRQPRALTQPAEDGGGGRQSEGLVGDDRDRVALDEAVPHQRVAGELGLVEEGLHPQGEDLVLIGQVLGSGGEQVVQAHV